MIHQKLSFNEQKKMMICHPSNDTNKIETIDFLFCCSDCLSAVIQHRESDENKTKTQLDYLNI